MQLPMKGSPLQRIKTLYQDTFNLSKDDRWVPDFVFSVLAQFKLGMQSELSWSILVGPPGCGKTEMTRPVQAVSWTHEVDDMTPKSFVSHFGLNAADGGDYGEDNPQKDVSLLNTLRGKVAIIPDFTTIIAKNRKERKEVLGALRRAYDRGSFTKHSGLGDSTLRSDFGLLGCCTGEIDPFLLEEATMGERFLKLRMWRTVRSWSHDMMMARWARKQQTTKQEWRDILRNLAKSALQPFDIRRKTVKVSAPEEFQVQLDKAITVIVRARIIPINEHGRVKEFEAVNRLSQSLANLANARCLLDERSEWNQDDLDFIMRVGIDTIPLEATMVLHRLYKWHKENDTIANLARRTHLPANWLNAIVRQFLSSGLLQMDGVGFKNVRLTNECKKFLRESRLGLALPENPGTHENFADPAILATLEAPGSRPNRYHKPKRIKGMPKKSEED